MPESGGVGAGVARSVPPLNEDEDEDAAAPCREAEKEEDEGEEGAAFLALRGILTVVPGSVHIAAGLGGGACNADEEVPPTKDAAEGPREHCLGTVEYSQ